MSATGPSTKTDGAKPHNERIRQIIDASPLQFREWLEMKLADSNEPSLRRRIEDLLAETVPASALLVKDAARFAHTVAVTRNYFTHYDERLQAEATTGEDLYWLTRKLQYVVMMCLLREIGLEGERVAELLNRNQSFLFTTRQ